MKNSKNADPLVRVNSLEKYFYENNSLLDRVLNTDSRAVKAVDGISFDIPEGETLGIVGESGCGKSTTGETILRLLEPTGGSVEFDGENIFEMNRKELVEFRRRAQIVFQDPFSSLNPRMTIGDMIREPLVVHDVGTSQKRDERVRYLLKRVGLSPAHEDRYPHEFSGGQRQRISIARALALEPEFVVLDEPTSALDVSVQAQILNLLVDLQEELELTYLLISHSLDVVSHICDSVAVMYLGNIVEKGKTEDIFTNPSHPYTQGLLESVPRVSTSEYGKHVETVSGDVPSPRNPPNGCRFHTRCPSIIPPERYEIRTDTYRSIMDLRHRLESDGLGDETLHILNSYNDVDEEPGDECLSHDEIELKIRDEFDLPTVLDDKSAEKVLSEGITLLIDGADEEAKDLFSDHFKSICESKKPKFSSISEYDHVSKCFLNN